MKTVISDKIKLAAPGYRLLKIEAQVANCDTPVELWREIEQLSDSLRQVMVIADINKRPAIAATRDAYKACGKDPNRYRPSSEALCRRILKGQDRRDNKKQRTEISEQGKVPVLQGLKGTCKLLFLWIQMRS